MGGRIPLIDVLDFMSNLLEMDTETGNAILNRLMPRDQSKDEFALYVFCWKMAKKGKRLYDVFQLLDVDESGDIDLHEFVDGVQKTLNLWLTLEECSSLFKFLDGDGSGTLELTEFYEKINILN